MKDAQESSAELSRHPEIGSSVATQLANTPVHQSFLSWTSEVTRYQWLVLFVAWLGWVFDSMDGTLFSLVQKPSMTELMGPGAAEAAIGFNSSIVFSVMLLGWAAGGICFGVIADYIGRTKALAATILIYSLFTGLSAAAQSWQQLAAFRFVTGLGLGGEWAAGAALVAEVWPDRLRAKAGGMLQSAAAFGYFFAALITRAVDVASWRYVYLVGAAPAIFVLFIRLLVKEPDRWVEVQDRRRLAKAEGTKKAESDAFTLKQLFGPKLRRDTLVASSLAFTVLLALWGATMWIPAVIREAGAREGLSLADQNRYATYAVMLLNGGSLLGYLGFGPLADRFGRRAAFLFFLIGGVILFPVTFLMTGSVMQMFILLPLVGIFTLGITSGFPIYLPELFPTRVRTSGVGLCYNLGRVVTAGGVLITGTLVGFFGSYAKAASAVSLIYVLGMLVLIFARETRGERLA
ncbi:MAG TPA: MFS transporter [Blastocatellia bacterium]|nr:MFS transporter [Blastocatellia bacterium]